jgi:alpha-amylase
LCPECQLNPHFGTASDLKALVEAAHARGMKVIFDYVSNHMGKFYNLTEMAGWYPFNDPSHFHDSCSLPYCEECGVDFTPTNNKTDMTWWQNYWDCRLFGLPDLNQSVPFVQQQHTAIIRETMETYMADAVRLDAGTHMEPEWLQTLSVAAGVPTFGELNYNPDNFYRNAVSSIQQVGESLYQILST